MYMIFFIEGKHFNYASYPVECIPHCCIHLPMFLSTGGAIEQTWTESSKYINLKTHDKIHGHVSGDKIRTSHIIIDLINGKAQGKFIPLFFFVFTLLSLHTILINLFCLIDFPLVIIKIVALIFENRILMVIIEMLTI